MTISHNLSLENDMTAVVGTEVCAGFIKHRYYVRHNDYLVLKGAVTFDDQNKIRELCKFVGHENIEFDQLPVLLRQHIHLMNYLHGDD